VGLHVDTTAHFSSFNERLVPERFYCVLTATHIVRGTDLEFSDEFVDRVFVDDSFRFDALSSVSIA